MAAVDDHRRRPDIRGRVAGLLQDLPRSVADVVARRADVDQVGGVDVDRQRRVAQLGGVLARRRLLPALRVREKDLDAVDPDRIRLRQRLAGGDVRADDPLIPCHGTGVSRNRVQPAWPRIDRIERRARPKTARSRQSWKP